MPKTATGSTSQLQALLEIYAALSRDRQALADRERQAYLAVLNECPFHVGDVVEIRKREYRRYVILEIAKWWPGEREQVVDFFGNCAPLNQDGTISKYHHREELLADHLKVVDHIATTDANPQRGRRVAR